MFKVEQRSGHLLSTFILGFLGIGDVMPLLSVSELQYIFFWILFHIFVGFSFKSLYLLKYISVRNKKIEKITGHRPVDEATGKGALSFWGTICFSANGFVGWMNLPSPYPEGGRQLNNVRKIEMSVLLGMMPTYLFSAVLIVVTCAIPPILRLEPSGEETLPIIMLQYTMCNFSLSAVFIPLIQMLPLPSFAGYNLVKAGIGRLNDVNPEKLVGITRVYRCFIAICAFPVSFVVTVPVMEFLDALIRNVLGVP